MSDSPKENTSTHIRKRRKLDRDHLGVEASNVRVIVGGPYKKTFLLPKALLCDVSAYFNKALKGEFKEGQLQQIELVEDNVESFIHFVLWLYTGSILQQMETIRDVEWRVIFDLYIFAEARDIAELHNYAIDALIDKIDADHHIPIDYVRYVYENTCEKDLLRKLLVDKCARSGNVSQWAARRRRGKKTSCPKAFLWDLAPALYEVKNKFKDKSAAPLETDFKLLRHNYHLPIEAGAVVLKTEQ